MRQRVSRQAAAIDLTSQSINDKIDATLDCQISKEQVRSISRPDYHVMWSRTSSDFEVKLNLLQTTWRLLVKEQLPTHLSRTLVALMSERRFHSRRLGSGIISLLSRPVNPLGYVFREFFKIAAERLNLLIRSHLRVHRHVRPTHVASGCVSSAFSIP